MAKTLEKKSKLVEPNHIEEAKKIARTLEKQLADQIIERRKDYEVIIIKGKKVGRVNGLAVMGGETGIFSGIILPIESQVTPGGKEKEIVATGKLGEIAKEAVKNVSAIIKKFFGEDIKEKHDLYVQFLQTYEGVEGDSASIAVATSIMSSKNLRIFGGVGGITLQTTFAIAMKGSYAVIKAFSAPRIDPATMLPIPGLSNSKCCPVASKW